MNTKYNKEDLKLNLPDYISGNIKNNELIFEIERELESNAAFKNEYSELKKTFGFLSTANLESPPESYFANLSVKINSKLQKENYTTGENFWERLSSFWKILVPAVTIIIIALILYFSFRKDESKIQLTDTKEKQVIEKEDNKNENKSELITKESNEIAKEEKLTSEVNNEKISSSNKVKIKSKKNKHSIEIQNDFKADKQNIPGKNEELSDLIADNIDNNHEQEDESSDEELFYSTDNENDDIEEEFFELTPEQQKEILDNLTKSQI